MPSCALWSGHSLLACGHVMGEVVSPSAAGLGLVVFSIAAICVWQRPDAIANVSGVTRKDRHRIRGSDRLSAARIAPSAGRYRTRSCN